MDERPVERPAGDHDGLSGIPRLIRATRVLFTALGWGFRREEALRLEMIGLLFAIPVALHLGEDAVERVLLISSALLLLIVELLNTAVEVTVDRISTDRHELSGLAKDLGSAAVGVTILLVTVTWTLLLTN